MKYNFKFSKIRSIKRKLLIQSSAIIAFTVILAGIVLDSYSKIETADAYSELVQAADFNFIGLNRAKTQFLSDGVTDATFYEKGDCPSLTLYHNNKEALREKLESIGKSDLTNDLNFADSLKIISAGFESFNQAFDSLIAENKLLGFKDFGMEGKMRKAVHSIETSPLPYDKVLMLTLRRHEKDFLLRNDEKYIAAFDKTAAEFAEQLNADPELATLVPALNEYKKDFHDLVALHNTIGIDGKSGLKGDLSELYIKYELSLRNLNEKAKAFVSETIHNAYWLFITVFLAQLIIGLAIANWFSGKLTKIIVALKQTAVKLSAGEIPKGLVAETEDELGELTESINKTLEMIQSATVFATAIGEGKLNIEYDQTYSHGHLAKALISMQEKLQVFNKETELRNWATQGLAQFADILRNNEQSITALGDAIISNLVKYVGANQGGLFIVNDSDVADTHLELIACYAWEKKKYLKVRIDKGEGLVGQAWEENDTLLITEVPANFVRITSGLGDANPNCFLIVPLTVNDVTYGVVEIASFKKFETHQIEFVKKLAESIAATLSTTKINERTKYLLEQSQMQTEQMRAQEEEMRQNMEEMQATAEELERKDRDTQQLLEQVRQQMEEMKVMEEERNRKEG